MVTPLLAALLAVLPCAPQGPGPVDAPVFTDTAFGVSLARPGDNWVFEPARSQNTTTVIFYPRGVSLADQLWGALVLTHFPRTVRLEQVASERVSASWQPTFGPSFQLLTRDSLTLAGLPAIHIVVSGTINRTAIDVEEYMVARGVDLILLQFRYPHGMPRDSIAQGYDRALRGFSVVAGAPVAATPPPAREPPVLREPLAAPPPVPAAPPRLAPAFTSPPRRGQWPALSWSPWRPSRIDATLSLDAPADPLHFAVRLELVNDGLLPLDSLPLWLPSAVALDSVLGLAGRLPVRYRGGLPLVVLPDTVGFQGTATIAVFYRGAPPAPGAVFADDWLPAVQSSVDSLGRAQAVADPPIGVRFDLPESLAGIASGRMSVDLVAAGRHRQMWNADGVAARAPGFVIGRFAAVARTTGRVAMTVWSPVYSDAPLDSAARLVAAAWAWNARAFGPVMAPELNVVVGAARDRGLTGFIMLTDSSADDALVVYREVARTWWGGAVRATGDGAWLETALPVWSALSSGSVGLTVQDAERAWRRMSADRPLAQLEPASQEELDLLVAKGVMAIEALRSVAGNARFRELIRMLTMDHRGHSLSLQDVMRSLAEPGRARLQEFLY